MLRWSVAESISSGSTSVDFRPLLWQTTGDDRDSTKAEAKHFNDGIWIHCVNYASLVSGTRSWSEGEIWCEGCLSRGCRLICTIPIFPRLLFTASGTHRIRLSMPSINVLVVNNPRGGFDAVSRSRAFPELLIPLFRAGRRCIHFSDSCGYAVISIPMHTALQ